MSLNLKTEPVSPPPPKHIQRAELVARLLDRHYLDPILGFVAPGMGDGVGLLLGLYIVFAARQAKASRMLQARMLLNLAADGLLGAVPLIGDLFDIAFKANTRNLELLKRDDVTKPKPTDGLVLALAFVLFLAALAVPVVVFVAFVKWMFS
ncbi:MAG: DUF4112 domain-containing protein [Deltaproteobacteria bacterium]|nr:DUF4112 domain-containing protein [Deltaproteobacteria bacterium]